MNVNHARSPQPPPLQQCYHCRLSFLSGEKPRTRLPFFEGTLAYTSRVNLTTYRAQVKVCSLTNISDEVLWALSDVNKVLRVVVVGVSTLRALQEDVGILVRGFRLPLSQNPSHFLHVQ